MSVETEAGSATEGTSIPESMSVHEAAALLRPRETEEKAPEGEAAPSEPNPADEADTAPPEQETSGKTEQADEPADAPPLDPPRSWTKEDKAIFASLPRESQQRLVEIDRARELEVRRGQNEVAEQRKAAEAAAKAADEQRQRYEAEVPNLLASIQRYAATEFADIKSPDDVRTLARDDPARYVQFLQMQQEYAQAQAIQRQSAERSEREQAKAFEDFKAAETKRFLEKAPEFADPAKAALLQSQARELFDDVGLTSTEFEALAQGRSGISLHDHRVQLIVRDALRYRAAEKAAKTPAARPLPPVQRPGTAQSKGERKAADIQSLSDRLKRTGSVADAAALYRARRG